MHLCIPPFLSLRSTFIVHYQFSIGHRCSLFGVQILLPLRDPFYSCILGYPFPPFINHASFFLPQNHKPITLSTNQQINKLTKTQKNPSAHPQINKFSNHPINPQYSSYPSKYSHNPAPICCYTAHTIYSPIRSLFLYSPTPHSLPRYSNRPVRHF